MVTEAEAEDVDVEGSTVMKDRKYEEETTGTTEVAVIVTMMTPAHSMAGVGTIMEMI